MNATATACQCCGEPTGPGKAYDSILGVVCTDCALAVRFIRKPLQKAGIGGVYHGPCGDNKRSKP